MIWWNLKFQIKFFIFLISLKNSIENEICLGRSLVSSRDMYSLWFVCEFACTRWYISKRGEPDYGIRRRNDFNTWSKDYLTKFLLLYTCIFNWLIEKINLFMKYESHLNVFNPFSPKNKKINDDLVQEIKRKYGLNSQQFQVMEKTLSLLLQKVRWTNDY